MRATTRQQRSESSAQRPRLRFALVALSALILITAYVFLGSQLLTSDWTVRAAFTSAGNLLPGSPVREAGVDVGQVTSVSSGPGHTSIVTIQVDPAGRPIHADATLAIEPRLALEGSSYIDLHPGTPSSRILRSGELLAAAQTTVAVQLDQVLDTFDLATRTAMQQALRGFATGLSAQPLAAAPTVPAGYSSLRHAVHALDHALLPVGQVAQQAQGTRPGDLHRLLFGMRDFTRQLAAQPPTLSDLVTRYSGAMSPFANQNRALERTITELDQVVRDAPRSFQALDRALPSLTRFSQGLDPALRAAPAPLVSATQLEKQIQGLTSAPELPSLLRDLSPITVTLPRLEMRLTRIAPLVTEADRCISGQVVYALNQKVPDGSLSTGDPAWLDLLHGATGTSNFTGGFDSDGTAGRLGVGEGSSVFTGIVPGLGAVTALAPQISGVRPAWLGYHVLPPFRPDVPCGSQPLGNLSLLPSGPAPDWARTPLAASALRGPAPARKGH